MTIAPVAPPDGEPVSVLGGSYAIRARNAAYALVESAGQPGSGLPPHALDGQDQTICVLSGDYVLVIGDERRPLAPGSIAVVPRDTVHSLTVTGERAGQALIIASPPGALDAFIEEVRLMGPGSTETVHALARSAGISLLTSPV